MIRVRGDHFCFWGRFQIHYLCTLCDSRSEHKLESILKTLRKRRKFRLNTVMLTHANLVPLGTPTFLDFYVSGKNKE